MVSEGVSGGHIDTDVATFRAILIMTGISFYNVLELLFLIFVTFKRYTGLYFWTLVVASIGCFLHGFGFLMKFFGFGQINNTDYFGVTIVTIGWYAMVTGQSLVLYARLHLVELNQTLRQRVLYVILIDAVILHVPTTVLTYGSNSPSHETFEGAYAVMEKIQMTWFTLQELMIAVIYIRAATRFMQNTTSDTRKKLLAYLLLVNVIIICLDLVLLGTEYANLYIIQVMLKGMVYSIKLKLEFSVLGKLIALARPPGGLATAATIDSRTTRAQSDGALFSPSSPEPFEVHKMRALSADSRVPNDGIWQRPRIYSTTSVKKSW